MFAFAQENNSTTAEEARGKEILQKLQDKQLTCQALTNDDYEKLGEYFMGQMAGSSHEAMNNMMKQMMGDKGEEQMHIAMGKRLSGCETNAQLPSNGAVFMPMMWMMGGGGIPMMGYGGFGLLGWLSMIIFWILLILGVVALIRYLSRSGPIDILKERFARGDIDKKEFEERKKDLS